MQRRFPIDTNRVHIAGVVHRVNTLVFVHTSTDRIPPISFGANALLPRPTFTDRLANADALLTVGAVAHRRRVDVETWGRRVVLVFILARVVWLAFADGFSVLVDASGAWDTGAREGDLAGICRGAVFAIAFIVFVALAKS